jgi:MoaA/NifB/PqqE/SkfB family radical SAM enzyme
MSEELVKRYQYGANYVPDYDEFRKGIINKTVIPYQVEVQPASPSKEICWLKCPWCYGLSATDTGERLERDRAVEIMHQIAAGGVKKIIFAGYATDPLNCRYLEDLLAVAVEKNQIFGFNTKAIKASDRLLELFATKTLVPSSYVSVSVDAGSNEVYNTAHAVTNPNARTYDRVRTNVEKMSAARAKGGAHFDITATYLINATNHSRDEISKFLADFRDAGCNLLRFTYPQLPRSFAPKDGVIPSAEEVRAYTEEVRELIASASTPSCVAMLVDADTDYDIFRRPRTMPCFARFIYPAVGFDGWLYHCSQSAAPNFRSMALGNLATDNFWDLYYNYDASDLAAHFDATEKKMNATGCRCDRKEHIVNLGVRNSGAFGDLRPSSAERRSLPLL